MLADDLKSGPRNLLIDLAFFGLSTMTRFFFFRVATGGSSQSVASDLNHGTETSEAAAVDPTSSDSLLSLSCPVLGVQGAVGVVLRTADSLQSLF